MEFRLNQPHVIAEDFGDEAVAVNFKTGSYYGLSGTALEVWRAIQNAACLDSLWAEFAARYSADPAEVRRACECFLSRLIDEELVVTEGGKLQPGPPVAVADFPAPVVQIYEDMKDLLLLDPIHDVDETGWPAAKPTHGSGNDSV